MSLIPQASLIYPEKYDANYETSVSQHFACKEQEIIGGLHGDSVKVAGLPEW